MSPWQREGEVTPVGILPLLLSWYLPGEGERGAGEERRGGGLLAASPSQGQAARLQIDLKESERVGLIDWQVLQAEYQRCAGSQALSPSSIHHPGTILSSPPAQAIPATHGRDLAPPGPLLALAPGTLP